MPERSFGLEMLSSDPDLGV